MASRGSTAKWLTGLALLLALSPLQAAKQRPATHSLLTQCQDASALPSPHCGLTPTPAFDPEGRLWVVFVQNNHLYLTHSHDLGQEFAPATAINRVPEAIYHDGENRPKLLIGPQRELYISWSQKGAARFAGHVRFSRSLDGGNTFSPPQTVNDDLAPIGHRFDSMALDRQGRIHITWIDKRDLARAKAANEPYAGAAIYHTFSEDRGESFRPNRKVADHSCQCCRIAMAADSDDRIVTLWRHIYPVNIRDHAIARLGVDSPPVSGLPIRATEDDWMVEGCPHHGPDLALTGDHKAHITWFTQGERNRGIMYGRFDLTRNHLETQQAIDPSSTASRPQIAAASGQLIALWKAFNGTATELRMRRSRDNGDHWGKTVVLATTADGSDYPLLVTQGAQVFASWHTRTEGYRLIPIPTEAQ